MRYPNNGFYSYINLIYSQYTMPATDNFLLKIVKVLPIIAWRTIKDAGIELLFLLIFWFVIMKMSQGRDLIVSLFEPRGLYGETRIVLTTLAVLSFSVSMWIIPAFLLQQRELRSQATPTPQFPFREHLFFMHRILPLVPFWLLAATLFNGHGLLFIMASLTELVLLYWFNHRVRTPSTRKWFMIGLGALLLVLTVYFFFRFQEQYLEMKVILAINLYFLSALMFLLYHEVDNRILQEHAKGMLSGQSIYSKYRINTIVYLSLAVLHLFLVLLIYYMPFRLGIAPESMLLYMFSVYVFAIDLFVYFVQVTKGRQLTAAIVIIVLVSLLASPLWNINVSHYTMDANADKTILTGRNRDNFEDRYKALKEQIDKNQTDTFPIILVSGEGGGSRAGLWFSQNLINFDYDTRGKFRNHIFSISTVSGSSIGLSTVFTFWEKTKNPDSIDQAWAQFPADVYANNYVGSSIRGLLLTDLYKSLTPKFARFKFDRNTVLQNEEAATTEKAALNLMDTPYDHLPDSLLTLKKDLMYFFYENKEGQIRYRPNTPITLINTCRSNDGRRGIFSSIRLSDNFFNEAIDIAGYLYEDTICAFDCKQLCRGIRKPISLGQACNTSELFPFFSAPAYIDSLGSFVDGGYHENSGLKSTLDIYQQLQKKLTDDPPKGKYKIYILYFKNGSSEKELYKKIGSEPTFLQPLTALISQPFAGSASYFEEKAKFVSAVDSQTLFVSVNLKPKVLVNASLEATKDDTLAGKLEPEILEDMISEVVTKEDGTKDTLLNFPLARWLSRTVIKRIQMCAKPANLSTQIPALLQQVNTWNKVKEKPADLFPEIKEHKQLRVAEDSLNKPKYITPAQVADKSPA